MKRFRKFLPSRRWLFLPPILAGVVVFAMFAMSKKELPRVEQTEDRQPLNVIRVAPRQVRPFATGYGTAVPEQVWTAIPEVSGRVIETHPELDSGRSVAAGQMLFRIDDSDYQLALTQRKADLAAARANVAELDASRQADERSLQIERELLEVLRSDWQRLQGLRESNAAAASELESVEGNFLRQKQAVQRLENSLSLYESKRNSALANVAVAESRVQVARRDVDRTIVRSPLSGVLAGVDLEVSQVVAAGQRLFEIQGNDYVELEARISFAQLEKLLPGQPAEEGWPPSGISDQEILDSLATLVSSGSGDGTRYWKSRPVRIAESVDRQTRTLGIVVRVENPAGDRRAGRTKEAPRRFPTGERNPAGEENPVGENPVGAGESPRLDRSWSRTPLRPGMFCEIDFLGQPLRDAIVLPRTALDGDAVYVVDGNDRLRRTNVRRGISIGENVTVTEGIGPGELVAIRPPVPAIDGALVAPRIVSEPAPLSWRDAATREQP